MYVNGYIVARIATRTRRPAQDGDAEKKRQNVQRRSCAFGRRVSAMHEFARAFEKEMVYVVYVCISSRWKKAAMCSRPSEGENEYGVSRYLVMNRSLVILQQTLPAF